MKFMRKMLVSLVIAIAMMVTVTSIQAQTQTDPPYPPKEGYHWVCGDPEVPTSCGWMEHPFLTDGGWMDHPNLTQQTWQEYIANLFG